MNTWLVRSLWMVTVASGLGCATTPPPVGKPTRPGRPPLTPATPAVGSQPEVRSPVIAKSGDPSTADAFFARGAARRSAGALNAALADFTRAVELDSKSADARTQLGLGLLEARQDDAAWKELAEALRLKPAANDDVVTAFTGIMRRRPPTYIDARPPRTYTPDEFRAAVRERLGEERAKTVANPVESTPEMKRWALELTEGARDDWDRARMLFDMVERHPAGNKAGFRPASEVFAAWRKSGESFNCVEFSHLYVALARDAGLTAFVVFTGEPYFGRGVSDALFGVGVFHVCVAVFVADKVLLVDPALNVFGPPHLDFRMLNDFQAAAGASSNRGFARAKERDWDAAIADFTKAIALEPKFAFAHVNRGLARKAVSVYRPQVRGPAVR